MDTGEPAYCANHDYSDPTTGTVYYNGQPAEPAIDYILYHANPTDALAGVDWEYAQNLLWYHLGQRDEAGMDARYPHMDWRSFIAEARSYAARGGGGPEAGFATYFPSPDGMRQGIVRASFHPRGWIKTAP